MRRLLIVLCAFAVAGCGLISSAVAQQQPCVPGNTGNFLKDAGARIARSNPAVAAQQDFERAVCEYRNCLTANSNNTNACEGLRHIMDASALAAGHYSGGTYIAPPALTYDPAGRNDPASPWFRR
jgi:hypothetical protein